ncbi:LysR family transcriptional activator of mexEF-oprN operon [Arthrobacter globiformis]|nr:LysR family transcriptional activator of mexEF-oprN operon [Arthrobacter globiformis]
MMMIMNESDLSRVDLNLLVTFTVLMQERHVTRTGGILKVSQAAVSASLRRLRRMLDDELFVRSRDGMVPTPKALEIAPRIKLALGELSRVLDSEPGFDPTLSSKAFTIAMSDDIEAHTLPLILQELERRQLKMTVIIRQANRHTIEGQLADGSTDLAIAAVPQMGGSYHQEQLFSSTYACVFDSARLGIPAPISLENYLSLRHLLVSFDGRRGLIDDLLEARGLGRAVAGSTSHFAGTITSLKAADVVVSLPRHAAAAIAEAANVTLSELPIPSPLFTVSMVWPLQREADPAHNWLRNFIRSILNPQ